MNYQEIVDNYLMRIITSDKFNLSNPCNNIDLLLPEFRDKVLKMVEDYKQRSGPSTDCPYIYETFRSHKLQSTYWNRGASKIKGGNILTAGMHHFGVAVDIIHLNDKNDNGLRDIGEPIDWSDIDYTLMRKIAGSYDIYSLGSYEVCHFQFIPTYSQIDLRNEVYKGVKQFQKDNELVIDGIIGPITIQKARELYV